MKQLIKYISIIGIALIMLGCEKDGGGGGSEDAAASLESYDYVAIDQETAKPLASAVYTKIKNASDTATSSASLATRSNTQRVRRAPAAWDPMKVAEWAVSNWKNITASSNHLRIESRSTITPRATESEVEDCYITGTTTITEKSRTEGQISPGDGVSITYDNCDDGDGAVIDGSIRIVFNRFAPSGDDYSITIYIDLTARNNIKGSSREGEVGIIQADMTLAVVNSNDTSTMTVSSDRYYVKVGEFMYLLENMTDRLVTDPEEYRYSYNATLTLQSEKIKGKVVTTTDPEFKGKIGQKYPDTGAITVTGANGSYVKLDADTGDNSTLLLTVDDGKSVTSEEVRWRELETR